MRSPEVLVDAFGANVPKTTPQCRLLFRLPPSRRDTRPRFDQLAIDGLRGFAPGQAPIVFHGLGASCTET